MGEAEIKSKVEGREKAMEIGSEVVNESDKTDLFGRTKVGGVLFVMKFI